MQICYLRSPDACVFTFSESDLLASLPDDPLDLWPPISLQFQCDETFDITRFNIRSSYVVRIPDHGSVIIPGVMLAGSASFEVGWPDTYGDIDACICISSVCTKQGQILVRGVFDLIAPVICEPNVQSSCFVSLSSPSALLNGLDEIMLVNRGSDITSTACLSSVSLFPSIVPLSTSTSTLNGAILLSRIYSISNVIDSMGGGDYLICFCAWESGCSFSDFVMYVGIFRVILPIKSMTVLPSSTVRVNNHQFSVKIQSNSETTGFLTCGVGTTPPVNSSSISTCQDFVGCFSLTTTTSVGENYLHFFVVNPLPEGLLNVWCYDTVFPCCVFPPVGYPLVSVEIGSEEVYPLLALTAYRDTEIVLPLRISSMGQYKLWSNVSSCHEPGAVSEGLYGLSGIECATNTSSCNVSGLKSSSLLTPYALCYCDQVVTDNECLTWSLLGTVTIRGPNKFPNIQYVVPSGEGQFNITGIGFEASDLVGIDEGIICQANLNIWDTTMYTNSTYESYTRIFPTKQTFAFCWCPEKNENNLCVIDPLIVQTVIVADIIDCVMSNWSIASVCSSPCGGGLLQQTRHVVVSPEGGGAVCSSELIRSVACNTQSCPPAIVRSIISAPELVHVVESFWVIVTGENLVPNADTLNIDSQGFRPCNVSSSSLTSVVCGNWTITTEGSFSIEYCSNGVLSNCVPYSDSLLVRPIELPATDTSTPWNGIIIWVSVSFVGAVLIVSLFVVCCKRKPRPAIGLSEPLSAPSTPTFPLEQILN